jgi:hypothetical protein
MKPTRRQFTGTFRAWLSIGNVVDAICNVQGIESTGCAVESSLWPIRRAQESSGYVVLASDYSELSTSGFRTALEDTGRLLYTGSECCMAALLVQTAQRFYSADTSIPTWGSSGLASTDFTTGASANSCTSWNQVAPFSACAEPNRCRMRQFSPRPMPA